jgi:adenine-specific DNA-methyltransferase
MEHMKFETPDMVTENIDKIAALFPSAVTEMRGEDGEIKRGVNFEVLKQLLSRDVVDGDECYEFTWVGKKAAMAEAARPITKTLRPVKEDSRNWDTTENLYIEGDNLEVLKILQESYLGKVKMIYIDPPYNTGNDFIYADDFMRSQEEENEQMGMYDEDENRLFKNADTRGRFHSDWCSMIYARLVVARNMLSEDGLIFITLDDKENSNMRHIADEILGASNFVTEFIWEKKKKPSFLHRNVGKLFDYILCYAKSTENTEAFSVEKTTEGKKYPFNNAGNGRNILHFPPHTIHFLMNDQVIQPQDMSEGNIYTKLLSQVIIKNHTNENTVELDGEWRYSQKKLDEIIRNHEEITISKIPFRPNHIKAGGEIKKMKNIISRSTYNCETNEDATMQIESLFGEGKCIFDTPKPVGLISLLVKAISKDADSFTVLDFFSGSATTAHAVMQLNAEDGGHRKFIMVQLLEKCDEASEAYKAGYKNICEIGKERIRRAGDKIRSEHPDAKLDTGFRVFHVDESNMEDVYYHPEELTQTMLGGMVSNIKPDRTDLDLLYACLLDWGVEINLSHTQAVIDGCTVHNVDNGALCACFDERVPLSVIDYMAKQQPLRAVFRDSSFAADDSKINVTEIFKNLSPDTKVKVI